MVQKDCICSGCSHTNDLSNQAEQSSQESVHPPTTPGEVSGYQAQSGKQRSPVRFQESVSLHSSDYVDLSGFVRAHADRLVKLPSHNFDPITFRRELAKMVLLHEYPVSIVDHLGFKNFVSSLRPCVGMVSQNTVNHDVMKVFKFERCVALSELGDPTNGRVAITTSTWTSVDRRRKFIAITGHKLDREWKRHSYIMRFAHMPIPCTNDSLSKFILECLSEFEVDDKLLTMTVDNYPDNNELMDILKCKLSSSSSVLNGALLKLPCFAQTMSLMVKDGFDTIRPVIEKIRDSIVFWTASPHRETEFENAACHLGISNEKSLVLDDESRWSSCHLGISHKKILVLDDESKWSSTYLMLQEIMSYKDVFFYLSQKELLFSGFPSEDECELTKEVCKRIEYLYDAMRILSECPLLGSCFNRLCCIKLRLSRWNSCALVDIRNMASKMMEKFDKYWGAARDVLAVGAFFDPRFKIEAVEFYFSRIYGSVAEQEVNKIRQICYDLFFEYQSSMPVEDSSDDNDDGFKQFLRNKRKGRPKDYEMDRYLRLCDESPDDEDCVILKFWKSYCGYPILVKIAKDFAAIRLLSVDPENIFDMGDRILDPHYSRLHPLMVETRKCTQSWIKKNLFDEGARNSSETFPDTFGTIHDNDSAEPSTFNLIVNLINSKGSLDNRAEPSMRVCEQTKDNKRKCPDGVAPEPEAKKPNEGHLNAW